MKSRILFIFISVLFINCSSETNNSGEYRSLWIIKSISPEIPSNPNQPDCRLMNDQIFFSDFGTLTWSYPLPDSNGSYSQPCQSGSNAEYFDYKKVGGEIKIYEPNTNTEVNWDFQLVDNLITVTRPNSITVYEKYNN
ncbi:hypothetical protein ACSVH2_10730 [Flavobacterium sp. RSB2_4_14]|uniref:hypothetical protein n=1 Tax=Flavobacterium sp. RSB2_4_14 TaxID=3447665 RepID=UPI003F2F8320